MKQKLITILMAMSISKAQAEKWLEKVDAPDEAEFDEKKIIAEYGDKVKDLVKNDPEFIKSIQTAEAAKRNEMWRTKVKKLTGLTAEEIKDKSDEEILALGLDKTRKKGDLTNEQLQAENVSLAAELKKIREEELPAAMKKGEERVKEINAEYAFKEMINGLPKKLRVGSTAAIATAKTKMNGQYVIETDETGKVVIKTKDGLQPKSADGTKLLSPEELVMSILDAEKLLENSGEGGGGTGGSGGGGGKGAGVHISADEKKDDIYARYPHLKKAEAQLEANKAAIEANKKK